MGRPSSYKPEYCEIVVEKMKLGAAIKELPYYIDACVDTINEWKKVHPEFSDAIKKGESYSEAIWMVKGRENLTDKTFNYVGWYMNMKNRFGWSDKTESRHDVKISQEDALKELG